MALIGTVRILFCMFGVAVVGTFIYTIYVDGLPFRKEVFAPWFVATLVDCYMLSIIIGAWVSYKESSWITALIWIILLIGFQSVTACIYMVSQLFKLSAEEFSINPVYSILIRHSGSTRVEGGRCLSIAAARVFFSILACPVLGLVIYAIVVDRFPLLSDLFTPWMTALTVNFSVYFTILSVWVIYKESSWMSSLIWIVLIIFFGSTAVCAYIVQQLFYLSSRDPIYLILVNRSRRNSETNQLLGDIESTDQ